MFVIRDQDNNYVDENCIWWDKVDKEIVYSSNCTYDCGMLLYPTKEIANIVMEKLKGLIKKYGLDYRLEVVKL